MAGSIAAFGRAGQCRRQGRRSNDQKHAFTGTGLAVPSGDVGHLVKPQQSASNALSQRMSAAAVICMNAMIAP